MALLGMVGKKNDQKQGFLEDGTRVPLSVVNVSGNTISQIKTLEKEGYQSLKIAFGVSKKKDKAGKNLPAFFREIRVDDIQNFTSGSEINPSDVFKPGDIVDVIGVSKGKGFAGVVKRHHFKGGPRTHGQSDRERAPGSIGQTTTPGRVYKGKRMAGRMGHQNVTVKNLEIIDITSDGVLLIKGLVPGGKNSIVVVKKVGENKKFVPLFKEEVKVKEPEVKTAAEEVKTVEEPKGEENAKES